MTEPVLNLADVRHEIDVLDDQIQDLLRRRAEAVEKVAIAKRQSGGADGIFLRPGREAQILRRLLARHHGPLAPAALARINRELVGALYELQAPVNVVVLAANRSVTRWDLARNFYGSTMPMTLCATASSAMRALSAQAATIGVMPMPEQGEKDAWWPMLANRAADTPRIVARLPFVPNPRGQMAEIGALVIARSPAEPSGDDATFVVLQLSQQGISQDRLTALVQQEMLPGSQILSQHRDGEGFTRLLVEVGGFITQDDARLAALQEASGGVVLDVVVIGACAVPLA